MCAAESSKDEVTYNAFQPLIHGVHHDVVSLLEQTVALFDEAMTLRIQHFNTIWFKMKFGLVRYYIIVFEIELKNFLFILDISW